MSTREQEPQTFRIPDVLPEPIPAPVWITHAFPIGGGWGYLCSECATTTAPEEVEALPLESPELGYCEVCQS